MPGAVLWRLPMGELTASTASLPEVSRRELSPELLQHAVETHGALIVRDFLPRDVALDLDASVLTAFAELDKPENERDPRWFSRKKGGGELEMARVTAQQAECALMVDCPDVFARVRGAYRDNGAIDVLTTYLGGDPLLSRFKATLRRTRPAQDLTDYWHQDGAFMGADMRVLNIWLALTDCGERAASVEVAGKRFHSVIECDYGVAVSAEKAASLTPQTFTPIFKPGDALMFDHLCLHRASRSANYSEERRALEMWFFDPATYPHNYDPRPIALAT
jgi:hypothetical protein